MHAPLDARALPHRTALFLTFLVAVALFALVVGARLDALARPGVVGAALALDLTLVVPGAFWFLVVRPRRWSVAPVLLCAGAGFAFARLVLPEGQRGLADRPEPFLAALELSLATALVLRVRAARLRARRDALDDPLERIRRVARELVPARFAAAALASELAVLRFALLPARPAALPAGVRAVTTHRRAALAGIVVALLFASAAEGIAVHVLLARWSHAAAWIATALTAYGALWLVAHLRATEQRPLLIDAEHVHVRAGLLWNARVPRARIAAVVRRQPPAVEPALATTLGTPPDRWLVLDEPVSVVGPYGRVRRVRALGVALDEPAALDGLAPPAA